MIKSQHITSAKFHPGIHCHSKVKSYNKPRQIVDLAFKMNKIKTKYNTLAQCKFESISLSVALLSIY